MKKTKKILPAVLLALVVAAPIAYSLEVSISAKVLPPITTDANVPADVKETLKAANEALLQQTVNNVSYPPRPRPAFRKDSWQWFWNEQAHLSQGQLDGFFGNTFIDRWLKDLANNTLIPFWDMAMQYDFVRALFLTFLVGLVLGVECLVVLAVFELLP